MAEPGREYEVISVSLPRDLVARVNEIVPKTRRSRIIRDLLSSFVDSVSRKRVAEEYSKALTEQIEAVDKRRLGRRLGTLPVHLLAQIDRALRTTLALR